MPMGGGNVPVTPANIDDVIISYNGEPLAGMSESGTKILKVKDTVNPNGCMFDNFNRKYKSA